MVKIRFKEGPHFNKLLLVKYVCQTLGLSLKEGKEAVDSGVIECPDHEYNNAIKKIAECGGIIERQVDISTESEKKEVEHKPAMLVKPNKNGTGLIIENRVPISEHTFQDLEKNHLAWVKIVTSIPFVVGLTQLCEKEADALRSLLAVEVPESHNTIDEIVSLSKTVDKIHAKIIDTVYKFHDLAKDLNIFIDDAPVETRSTSHD